MRVLKPCADEVGLTPLACIAALVACSSAAFARVVGVADPQGITDLAFTTQELALYGALDGTGAQAHTFNVNVYGSSFGGWELATYFAGSAPVLAAMCARPWWPGEITATDASGHVTRAKLRVPIVH